MRSDVVAASRKAVRAPASAASSGSIDSIIRVRNRPPCRAVKMDSASVSVDRAVYFDWHHNHEGIPR
jgi:hypothetical protein